MAANKSDLYEQEHVKEDEGRNFAHKIGAIFKNTSAFNGIGIDEIFKKIGYKLIDPNYKDQIYEKEEVIINKDNNENNNGEDNVKANENDKKNNENIDTKNGHNISNKNDINQTNSSSNRVKLDINKSNIKDKENKKKCC